MLQKTSIAILIVIMAMACTDKEKYTMPERKPLSVTAVMADSLYTSFPGTLQVTSNHLALLCPFDGSEKFLMIYDRQTGEQITRVGSIGQGPGEWITPDLANVIDDKLVIFDINLKDYVLAGADNLYQDISRYDSVRKMDVPELSPLNFLYLDDDRYIIADYGSQQPFNMISKGRIIPCGKYPFNKTITNAYIHLQGQFLKHPHKEILIYGTIKNPYLALYRIGDNDLDLIWENQFKKPDYSIDDQKLEWGSNQPDGIFDAAFTKDYIVCLIKDFKNDAKGRDIRTAPKAVYLFNYEGQLMHILDLATHTSRLAADGQSNTFYAVSLEPDYSIVKYDLSTVGL